MKKYFGKFLALTGIILVISALGYGYYIFNIPSSIEIFEDETKQIDVGFPFDINCKEASNVLKYSDSGNAWIKKINISPIQKGNATIQLTLFNKIAVKDISVNVIPDYTVIPGGHSIGVKMNIKGVLVVGLEDIKTEQGTVNPGLKAGLQIGDILLEVDGIKVINAKHVQEIINDVKKEVKLKVKRKDEIINIKIIPVLSSDDNQYRMGLWVRDKTAGIGTLTFYDPQNKIFGALGHAITDSDTGVLLNVQDGEILNSKVVSVRQGRSGNPGEIKGIFYETDFPLGQLIRNTNYGIFGSTYNDIENPIYKSGIEIGYQSEIKKGKAYILTTLDSNKIEKYEIMIEKINYQMKPSTKSMVIKVTDKKLLKKSGGIIQGMSGSPIIQNGKLIGAVTHVFVNDPQKGYAVFIEWMLKEGEKTQTDDFYVNKTLNAY